MVVFSSGGLSASPTPLPGR